MAANPKRMRYVSENEFFSSDDGETSVDADYNQHSRKNSSQNAKGKNKWVSRNAMLARENRLKKKLYVTNLETEVGRLKGENDNFTKVIENQSSVIDEQKKQIKYLKSVIANSSDIGSLIKNIHRNTGMSVTTSLDQTLCLNNDFSKRKQPIARKTAHPWEETLESDSSDLNNLNLFTNSDIGDILDIPTDSFDNLGNENNFLEDHNYTVGESRDDVGVCLHVSKHRVSLEFCSTCSDNACEAWRN